MKIISTWACGDIGRKKPQMGLDQLIIICTVYHVSITNVMICKFHLGTAHLRLGPRIFLSFSDFTHRSSVNI
jgi:hypothetical protein